MHDTEQRKILKFKFEDRQGKKDEVSSIELGNCHIFRTEIKIPNVIPLPPFNALRKYNVCPVVTTNWYLLNQPRFPKFSIGYLLPALSNAQKNCHFSCV